MPTATRDAENHGVVDEQRQRRNAGGTASPASAATACFLLAAATMPESIGEVPTTPAGSAQKASRYLSPALATVEAGGKNSRAGAHAADSLLVSTGDSWVFEFSGP